MSCTKIGNQCSCGNTREPIYWMKKTTQSYEGIYFVLGQTYEEQDSFLTNSNEPECVTTPPKDVNKTNKDIAANEKPQVAVISPLVATPAPLVDTSINSPNISTEQIRYEEILSSGLNEETVSENAICLAMANAIKNFHKSGKKLRAVTTKPRQTNYYDALTASMIWTMEKIFQVVNNEECYNNYEEEIGTDWGTE